MAAIYLALRVIDQRTAPAHALALTAAGVLLATPLSISDVGFWLTFGATLAIVAGVARFALPTSWARVPLALVLASAAAEAALMPVGAMVFQRVTLAGPVLNLVAVPCMGLVQIAAMMTVAADCLGLAPLANAAGWVAHLAARGLVDSAALVDLAPWVTWRVVPPSPWLVVAYYRRWLLVARHSAVGLPRSSLAPLKVVATAWPGHSPSQGPRPPLGRLSRGAVYVDRDRACDSCPRARRRSPSADDDGCWPGRRHLGPASQRATAHGRRRRRLGARELRYRRPRARPGAAGACDHPP